MFRSCYLIIALRCKSEEASAGRPPTRRDLGGIRGLEAKSAGMAKRVTTVRVTIMTVI